MTGPRLKAIHVAATSLFAGSVLAACAIGPRYVPPQVPLPAAFKEQAPADTQPLQPASPRDQIPRQAWWEPFQDPQLNEFESRLLRSNPTLAEAEARFRLARALVRQDRAGLFPVVTGSTAVTRSRPASGTRTTTGDFTEYALVADLSWEADLWGRVRQTIAGSRASAQAAAGDVETVRLSLGAELAVDYFELRSLDAELALFDQTIAAYERAATLTRNQYNAGIVSRADVEQAETQLTAAQAQAVDVQLQRAQLEHAIAVLIGEFPASVTVALMPLAGEPPVIPADLPSRLLERRPDVASAERRVAAANAQIGVASAAFFPTVMLGASGGFQAVHLLEWLSWPTRVWSVGPAVAATLVDAGRRRAIKAEAIASYDETVAAYRQTVLAAFQDVEDNLAAQRLLGAEAERQRAAVAAAQRSLDIALNQYRAGLVSYLQVATQQTALLTNQRAAVSLAGRQFVAAVQLVRSLGGGWSGDLKQANP